jgi:Flp pilus assembly protein TadG
MKIPSLLNGQAISLMQSMGDAAASKAPETSGGRGSGRLAARLRSGEEGGALVETAVMLPVFLTIMLAIFTVGIAMNNFQMLTNSINVGGTTLQQIRNMTGASDPCAAVGTAVMNAAPYLTSSGTNAVQLTISLDNGGYTQGPAASSTISCTGGASYVLQGTNASITATYPCNLTIYGVNYAPGCKLHASVTELMQ